MRLLKLRIQEFQCIEDSEPFSLHLVTCLVGKNESGKTALLRALHKLNPDDAAKGKFEPARDYPRRKWCPDTPVPAVPPVITTTWELDDADIIALEQEFGAEVIVDRNFTLTKGYDNHPHYDIKVDEVGLCNNLIADAHLAAEERGPIPENSDVRALQETLTQLIPMALKSDSILGIPKAGKV